MRVRLTRRVRFVAPHGQLLSKPRNAHGEPGIVTAGALVAGEFETKGTLDEVAHQVRSIGATFEKLVHLSQAAHAAAAELARTLAELERLEYAPGCPWASSEERQQLADARGSIDELRGLGERVSPVPVFGRDIPAKYWTVGFLREQGLTVEEAHDAVSLSESATRKFWRDYNAKPSPDPSQVCTYCGALLDSCVCRPVTSHAAQ